MELERPVRGGLGLAHGAHGGGPHHSPRVQMVPRAGWPSPLALHVLSWSRHFSAATVMAWRVALQKRA